jgi:voltage-gated potassium channel
MFLFFWRGLDHLSTIMNVKLLKRSLLYGLLAMLGGAMLFMSLEKVKGGDGSFVESLWWSFTTLVTGGFADIHNPSTMGGKVLTVMLVIGGMVLVGVFTATLTSVLVRDDDSWQKQDTEEQLRHLNKLERTLESIDLRLKNIEEKEKDT